MTPAKQWFKMTCRHCPQVMVWQDDAVEYRTDLMQVKCPKCHKYTGVQKAIPVSDLLAQVLLAKGMQPTPD